MLKTYLGGAALTFIATKAIGEDTKPAIAMSIAWPLMAFGIVVQQAILGAAVYAAIKQNKR